MLHYNNTQFKFPSNYKEVIYHAIYLFTEVWLTILKLPKIWYTEMCFGEKKFSSCFQLKASKKKKEASQQFCF